MFRRGVGYCSRKSIKAVHSTLTFVSRTKPPSAVQLLSPLHLIHSLSFCPLEINYHNMFSQLLVVVSLAIFSVASPVAGGSQNNGNTCCTGETTTASDPAHISKSFFQNFGIDVSNGKIPVTFGCSPISVSPPLFDVLYCSILIMLNLGRLYQWGHLLRQ